MEDNEIYQAIDHREEVICKRFDATIKTLTEFIALENQDMKKSIDDLTKRVTEQNGSVRELREWRARSEGAAGQRNKGFDKALRVMMFVLAFGALIATVYFGNKKTREDVSRDVVDMLDQYSFDIQTRSWSLNRDSI